MTPPPATPVHQAPAPAAEEAPAPQTDAAPVTKLPPVRENAPDDDPYGLNEIFRKV